MKKITTSWALLFLTMTSSIYALNLTDQKSINQIIEHISNAWNYHEGIGFAKYYSEDADFVNVFGMTFVGREEIENRHITILETFLKGSWFEVIDIKVREVNPDIAIVQVRWKVSNIQKPIKNSDHGTMQGVFTHVFVKFNEAWEITASQNTITPDCAPNP